MPGHVISIEWLGIGRSGKAKDRYKRTVATETVASSGYAVKRTAGNDRPTNASFLAKPARAERRL